MAEITCREKIMSNDYYDWIIDFPLEEVLAFTDNNQTDFCYQQIEEGFGIVSLNKNQLPDGGISAVDYFFFPELFGLEQISDLEVLGEFDPQPLSESGVIRVQDGPLGLTGDGIILAFADTGIRYENPVFRRGDGSSRVLAVWDQTIQDGEPPEGFLYGTEYRREQINAALLSENPQSVVPTTDENGHGTKMVSVACGSLLAEGSGFRSPAYDADILMVKLKPAKEYLQDYNNLPENVPAYQSSDIMMAIKYLDSYARAFQRPIVFCLGLGSNFGDHAGTGILSRYLAFIGGKRSRVMVISGGNEGNYAHHYEGRLNIEKKRDDIEIRVPAGRENFMLQLWGTLPTNLSLAVQAPGGEVVPALPVFFQNNLRYRFVYEGTTITVYSALTEQGSGDELFIVRFENPTEGIWTLQVSDEGLSGNTVFHAWLPIREFLRSEVYFLRSSPDITLTTPAYIEDAIAVSTYNSYTNSFYIQSGRGFSRSNIIKPDFAAPGVDISVVENMIRGNPVVSKATGSSLAAALCAGCAAQILQWAVIEGNSPYVRSREVKNLLIRGAVRDRDIEYPSTLWGFGKMDVYQALELQ